MKKKICFLSCLLLYSLLYSCQIEANLSELFCKEDDTNIANDCALCGNQHDSLMGYYRRFDSIGIICINS